VDFIEFIKPRKFPRGWLSCSAATGGWSSFPSLDVADTHINGYVYSGGTVSIYAFDQELHLTVRAWTWRHDGHEVGFLLGKGHAPRMASSIAFGDDHFSCQEFWCDDDDARSYIPDLHTY
jgi:hypothetical protein